MGIGVDTSRTDMFYAVIEGLCFGFRELSEKMKLPLERYGSVKVVGGGAKSPVWMQTMANVLNIRIEKNGRYDRACVWDCPSGGIQRWLYLFVRTDFGRECKG